MDKCGEPENVLVAPQNILFVERVKSLATHAGFPNPRHPKYIVPLRGGGLLLSGLRCFISPAKMVAYYVVFFVTGLGRGFSKNLYAEAECLREIKKVLGCECADALLATGTPGPLNKATLLLKYPDGKVHSFIKVATTNKAMALVKREFSILDTLQKSTLLSGYIPKVLSIKESENYTYLAMTPAKGIMPTGKLTKAHTSFLNNLNIETQNISKFSDSAMWTIMAHRYSSLEGLLSEEWRERLKKALEHLRAGFSGETIPMSLAHRDFAPWNMRVANENLCIFDWEYAEEGYLPLYDIYHYLAMPQVLRKELEPGMLRNYLVCAQEIVRENYNTKDASCRPDLQLLAYFTDVCLYYLEANSGRANGDKVLARYGKTIDDKNHWCETV